ncbi:class I SAM-dependent methyltransferase [Sphingosinicella ginsenosidimutans]|uniref:Class I SAM-dependent methyltransferase n=1 Tax=Allosphingosinicella ginsenosidimutans TaxID=1176539 RepID=A0A5C6TVM7_9SPHN|nr:class I SAM-dependent methyltransferase [Sphingosinicella ginsenosidimutans]TXC63658.1 class I SAM-dependent methyltransferase [Sphingosinicella ginsenosidimutans]TXC63915.1 class I SAM-dependent methyltransferase [Sphingosinicella ginsenosidimutans]
MSKRAPQFERRERDFYPTPRDAVFPLLPHLAPATRFAEPCAGDGRLLDHLTAAGHVCVDAWDIEPRRADIARDDATMALCHNTDCYITNPPWDRRVLHPIILNLSRHKPTWLLFDADWMHTRQSAEFMPLCRKIVSVGRVKWIEDSPFTSKDNAAWYLFDANAEGPACFIGRERQGNLFEERAA